MRTAWVTMPLCGSISLAVEVDDDATKDDVTTAFYDALEASEPEVKLPPNFEMTWETMPYIVRGNVFYGETNDMLIEWDDGAEDDD